MKEHEDSILNDEEFINLSMSSLDRAVALFREKYRGEEDARKRAEDELRERIEDITDIRKKDNTIKVQGRDQAITKALDVVSDCMDNG